MLRVGRASSPPLSPSCWRRGPRGCSTTRVWCRTSRTGIAVSRREADISVLRDLPHLQLSAGLTTANVHAWLYYLFWTLACRLLWSSPCGVESLGVSDGPASPWPSARSRSSPWPLTPAFCATRSRPGSPMPWCRRCLLGAWLLGLVWMMKGRLAFRDPGPSRGECAVRGDRCGHLGCRRRARQAGRGRRLRGRPRTPAAAHGGCCQRAHATRNGRAQAAQPRLRRTACRSSAT